MKNRLQAANDIVMTNPVFAKRIVDYFKPTGSCLDPCKGDGAFANAMPGCDWCEITEGKNFLIHQGNYNWIITNPPWSSKAYRAIAQHAFDLADNVVFLIRLDLAIGTYARQRDYQSRDHGLKEVIICKYEDAGFTQKGFALAVLHWQKIFNKSKHARFPIRTTWTDWTRTSAR
jgi:hypothetical protein